MEYNSHFAIIHFQQHPITHMLLAQIGSKHTKSNPTLKRCTPLSPSNSCAKLVDWWWQLARFMGGKHKNRNIARIFLGIPAARLNIHHTVSTAYVQVLNDSSEEYLPRRAHVGECLKLWHEHSSTPKVESSRHTNHLVRSNAAPRPRFRRELVRSSTVSSEFQSVIIDDRTGNDRRAVSVWTGFCSIVIYWNLATAMTAPLSFVLRSPLECAVCAQLSPLEIMLMLGRPNATWSGWAFSPTGMNAIWPCSSWYAIQPDCVKDCIQYNFAQSNIINIALRNIPLTW